MMLLSILLARIFTQKNAGAEVFKNFSARNVFPLCGVSELTAHRDPGPADRAEGRR